MDIQAVDTRPSIYYPLEKVSSGWMAVLAWSFWVEVDIDELGLIDLSRHATRDVENWLRIPKCNSTVDNCSHWAGKSQIRMLALLVKSWKSAYSREDDAVVMFMDGAGRRTGVLWGLKEDTKTLQRVAKRANINSGSVIPECSKLESAKQYFDCGV